MIPSELDRICRSAAATGPFGSKTPSEQPPSIAAPVRTMASTAYRISDLVCGEFGGAARGAERSRHGVSWCRSEVSQSDTRGQQGRPPIAAIAGQQRREQHEQVDNGKCKQTVSGSPIRLAGPAQLPRERHEQRSTDGGSRTVDCAGKAECPGEQRNRQQ